MEETSRTESLFLDFKESLVVQERGVCLFRVSYNLSPPPYSPSSYILSSSLTTMNYSNSLELELFLQGPEQPQMAELSLCESSFDALFAAGLANPQNGAPREQTLDEFLSQLSQPSESAYSPTTVTSSSPGSEVSTLTCSYASQRLISLPRLSLPRFKTTSISLWLSSMRRPRRMTGHMKHFSSPTLSKA